jgi:integrase
VQAILGDVAKGRDPATERKAAARAAKEKADAEALTLGALIDKWLNRHLVEKRAAYAVEATRALRFAFKKHLASPATTLTPKAVKAILNAMADDGKKAAARLAGAYGRACYGWAVGKDLLAENPFAGIKLEAVASRDTVLTDDNMRAVWEAAAGPGSFNAIVRMLILTGQRRAEVAGMTWDEIAPDLRHGPSPEAAPRMVALTSCRHHRRRGRSSNQRMGASLSFRAGREASVASQRLKSRWTRQAASKAGDCTISAARWRPGCKGWAFALR